MRALPADLCTLEPQVAGHAAEMFAVLSDPAIYEFENKPPVSQEWLASRYAKLEARSSPDGRQKWLNWVIRLPGGRLAGYVQATVLPDGKAYVAYELNSQYWRQGIGNSAVGAMLHELQSEYGVHIFVAVLKTGNYRSLALLHKLGFKEATAEERSAYGGEPDESVMVKAADGPHDVA